MKQYAEEPCKMQVYCSVDKPILCTQLLAEIFPQKVRICRGVVILIVDIIKTIDTDENKLLKLNI